MLTTSNSIQYDTRRNRFRFSNTAKYSSVPGEPSAGFSLYVAQVPGTNWNADPTIGTGGCAFTGISCATPAIPPPIMKTPAPTHHILRNTTKVRFFTHPPDPPILPPAPRPPQS